MENRTVKIGEFYRHFKNKLYQIVTIAEHSETKEKLVIYQALYGDYGVYARPLEMFVSEVDHVKYPDVAQKYRFERVEPQKSAGAQQEPTTLQTAVPQTAAQQTEVPQSVMNLQPDDTAVDPNLMAFLDADTFEEKYKILTAMESDITDSMVNNLAVVLDVVIPEGSLDDRYRQLKQCVSTRSRYESTRLR